MRHLEKRVQAQEKQPHQGRMANKTADKPCADENIMIMKNGRHFSKDKEKKDGHT